MVKRRNVETAVMASLLDTAGEFELPTDLVDAEGRRVEPDEPNAVKLEMFVFDALPRAAVSVSPSGGTRML
jgi:hypothetical protein